MDKQNIKAKLFHLNLFFCFRFLGKTKSKIFSEMATVHCLGNYMMRLLIKPGNQTDETESPDLVKKTRIPNR